MAIQRETALEISVHVHYRQALDVKIQGMEKLRNNHRNTSGNDHIMNFTKVSDSRNSM